MKEKESKNTAARNNGESQNKFNVRLNEKFEQKESKTMKKKKKKFLTQSSVIVF